MKKLSYISIAFTYVGTVVGAGFASGQELKKYFVDYGVCGFLSFCLSAFLFFYLGQKIMILCFENNVYTYDKLLNLLSNSTMAKVFDFFITLFLIGTLTTMSAGMGTMLEQVFNIPLFIGSLSLMLCTVFIVKKGINEISKLNACIVPILIFVTIVISMTSFNGVDRILLPESNNIIKSIFSSILYVAYNIVMSISILPSLAMFTNKKELKKGAMLCGIIIGALGFLISIALVSNYDIIQNVEIPLVVLSNKFAGVYIIMFILEVFSTAVSSLYGVYARINRNNKLLYMIAIFSFCFSLFGFSNLVTYLYGIMGLIGVFMIVALVKGSKNEEKNNNNF